MSARFRNLESALRITFPEMMKKKRGCGCRDAAKVIQRWGVKRSLQKVDVLTRMICSTNKQLEPPRVRALLVQFLEGYNQ